MHLGYIFYKSIHTNSVFKTRRYCAKITGAFHSRFVTDAFDNITNAVQFIFAQALHSEDGRLHMSKPDNRQDNAMKIKQNIENTKHNIELAEEMIAETSDDKTRADLKAKNERRQNAIPDMEREMKDEAEYQR